MNNFTNEELKHFCTAYIIEANDNPHERFSELLGIKRGDAKVLCYKIMYSRQVTKSLIDSIHEAYGDQL